MVPTISAGANPLTVNILLNNCLIEFQTDTGDDASVILEDQHIPETETTYKGPIQDKLQAYGQFTCQLIICLYYAGNFRVVPI